ncbi:hypothetical protein IFT73_17540 [Aeromicrobium sp. CFBP 8757]|uniref:hypothetical protein n=1 Tax=Aeromicrobium sp. CFBP 8757 TaxID=2775288 RepID=UPI001786A601|nr:hypothetical protein [Aeromicrobium sp. CFBP 8757]MBD8608661.1 hypothetical protein [Aeromicrobium sp. CFBP 8757]
MKRRVRVALVLAMAVGALPHCQAEPDSQAVDRPPGHSDSSRSSSTDPGAAQ